MNPFASPASDTPDLGLEQPLTLRSVDPYSAAVTLGVLYGVLGTLVVGLMMCLMLVGGLATGGGMGGLEMGVFMVAPLFYAVMGFLGGGVMAIVYNLIARNLGGLSFRIG